jgi:nicotinamide mononucleotide transporter
VTSSDLLEIAGVAFNLGAVVLAWRRHISTWPVGLVGAVLAGISLTQSGLYADAGLQVLFFGQGLYGWWSWRRPVQEVPIRRLRPAEWGALTVTAAVGTAALAGLLRRTTDSTVPEADALLAVLSVTANQLLTRRILDNWPLWILIDVLYVPLLLHKGLPRYAGLYVVFTGIAIGAWWQWTRAYRAQQRL